MKLAVISQQEYKGCVNKLYGCNYTHSSQNIYLHKNTSLRPEQGYSKNTVLKAHERPKPVKRNAGDYPTLVEQAPIVYRHERMKPINFMDLKGSLTEPVDNFHALWVFITLNSKEVLQ